MVTRSIPAPDWGPYLLRCSPMLRYSRATVEVLDPDRERLIEAWKVLLHEVSLDAETGDLVVTTADREHRVAAITGLSVIEDAAGRPTALQATARDGVRHVIQLKPPLAIG